MLQFIFRANFDLNANNIMLIRDPLGAAMSEFNRKYCWHYEANNIKDFSCLAPLEAFKTHNFTEYVKWSVNNWVKLHDKMLEKCSMGKCHFVLYEDLKNDLINEMTTVLKILGFKMNYNTERCLLENAIGNFKCLKRSDSEMRIIYDMFTTEQMNHFQNLYVMYSTKLKILQNPSYAWNC